MSNSDKYTGSGGKRPPGWDEEDEKALQAEAVGGHCGCDGALDFGCTWCTPVQFDNWWLQRSLTKAIEKSNDMAEKCAGCGCKLSGFVTGKNQNPKGTVCDDCHYADIGEEIDNHPIGGAK
jgi:hypothetical protein